MNKDNARTAEYVRAVLCKEMHIKIIRRFTQSLLRSLTALVTFIRSSSLMAA